MNTMDTKGILDHLTFVSLVSFVVGSVLVAAAQAPARQTPERTFDLEEATIAQLQQRMAAGQDTARSLAEKYLARIDAIDRQADRQGPALHSVIETNPDALTIADALDADTGVRDRRLQRGAYAVQIAGHGDIVGRDLLAGAIEEHDIGLADGRADDVQDLIVHAALRKTGRAAVAQANRSLGSAMSGTSCTVLPTPSFCERACT